MQFVSQTGNAYNKVVFVSKSIGNMIVSVSFDGSFVLFEKTELEPGIYTLSSDIKITDINIVNSVESIFARMVNGKSLEEYLKFLIKYSVENGASIIKELPKLNKTFATSLDSLGEVITFYWSGKDLYYLCIGYREPIAKYLEENEYETFYTFAGRFYKCSSFETRYKNDFKVCRLPNNAIMLISKEQDKFGLVMPVEWQKHSKFLEKNLF